LKEDKEKAAIAQEAKQNEYNEQKNKFDESKNLLDSNKTKAAAAKKAFDDFAANGDATQKAALKKAMEKAQADQLAAETANLNFQKAFDKVNNELLLKEEEARQKQIQEQKNEVFNTAKQDVKTYEMIKKQLENKIATVKKVIANIPATDATNRKSEMEAKLASQEAALAEVGKMITKGSANFDRIKKASDADKAAEVQRKNEAKVADGKREMERNKDNLAKLVTQITDAQKIIDTTKSTTKKAATTEAINKLKEQKSGLEKANTRIQKQIDAFNAAEKKKGDDQYTSDKVEIAKLQGLLNTAKG